MAKASNVFQQSLAITFSIYFRPSGGVIQNGQPNRQNYNGTNLQFLPSQLNTLASHYLKHRELNTITSSVLHIWMSGHLYTWNLLQDAMSRFDDVIVAAGSGGTAEGLSIGNHLSDAGLK